MPFIILFALLSFISNPASAGEFFGEPRQDNALQMMILDENLQQQEQLMRRQAEAIEQLQQQQLMQNANDNYQLEQIRYQLYMANNPPVRTRYGAHPHD